MLPLAPNLSPLPPRPCPLDSLPLNEERLRLLESGVAAHHAGMLPIEKGLIEGLFQEALIKVSTALTILTHHNPDTSQS